MHKTWGKIVVAVSFAVLALGCQPRDVDPRYGTVEAGKVGSVVTDFRDVNSPSKDFNFKVEYEEVKDQPGQQLSTCTSGFWTDIRMYDRSNKDRTYKAIYSGERVAVLGPAMNCQKVGMRVLITSTTDKGKNYGHAVVTKLMLIDRSQISTEMLVALDQSESSLNAILKTSQTASILVFKYVKGSAPEEEKFLNVPDPVIPVGDSVGNLIGDFSNVDSPSKSLEVANTKEAKNNIGEKLSTCTGKNWNSVRIYDVKDKVEVFKKVYLGQRVAVMDSIKNCHTVGMRIAIESYAEKGGHYGEAIVTGLYTISKESLTPELLTEVDRTTSSVEFFKEPEVTITVFKYIKGSAKQEAEFLNGETPTIVSPSTSQTSGSENLKPEENVSQPNNGVNVTDNNDSSSGGIHIYVEGNPTEPITITIKPGANGAAVVSGGDSTRVNIVTNDSGNTTGAVSAPVVNVQTITQNIEETGEDMQVVEYLNRKGLLSSCTFKSPWSSYRSFRKLDDKLYAGELVTRVGKGTLNCYEPGAIIDIEGEIGKPARGQVKIKEVFVMRKKDLTDALIATTGQTRAELEAYLNDADLINITIFEYIKGSAEQATAGTSASVTATVVDSEIAFKPGQILKSCSKTQTQTLTLSQTDLDKFNLSSYKKAFLLPEAPCAAVGSFADLELNGQSVLKDQVKIVRVELKKIMDLDDTDFEELGFTSLTDLISTLVLEWNSSVQITPENQIAIVYVRN